MDVALFVKTADAPKTFVLSTTSGGDILQTTATQTAVALSVIHTVESKNLVTPPLLVLVAEPQLL